MNSFAGQVLRQQIAVASCRRPKSIGILSYRPASRHQRIVKSIRSFSTSTSQQSDDSKPSNTYTKLSRTSTTIIPSTENAHDIRVKISHLSSGITHVLLARPSKLNSLDLPMFESIAEAASTIRNDKDCRVVILSGDGRAFCTGLDAKSVALEGKALERLLSRPSAYGGEDGRGNLAQDVGYLWRCELLLYL